MLKKLAALGVFLLVLAPSAYLAWKFRAMGHLGYYHDDSIYWVSARSLALGNGYKIASLPGEPYQTKYPPLYPALLAVVWKINPNFPGNLPLATLFSWLLLPVYLAMAWLVYRQFRFGWREQVLLAVITGLSPVAVVFGFSLMPELLFALLLLASVLLAERSQDEGAARWLPIMAGICGALAYLAKSSAAPLLLTAPICFGLRKQWTKAALFFAAMIPAVVGWQWWVSGHVSHSWDLVTLYYTNYTGYQIYNVPLRDLPLVVWHNLDALLMGIGRLLTFDVAIGSKHLERVVAVAAIVGSVRLARRSGRLQFPIAALGISALMLIWHFTPDQRFVFPLYPLLLAGLWTELANFWAALRAAWKKPALGDRIMARAMAGVLAGFVLFVAGTTGVALFWFLPVLFETYQHDLEARLPAYEWIERHSSPQSQVFAYDDPMLFLYTGRKSCSLPVPPRLQYHGDEAGIDRLLTSIPSFAREHQLGYVLLTSDDFYRDLHEHGAQVLSHAVQSNGAFQQTYQSPAASVYRFDGLDQARARY